MFKVQFSCSPLFSSCARLPNGEVSQAPMSDEAFSGTHNDVEEINQSGEFLFGPRKQRPGFSRWLTLNYLALGQLVCFHCIEGHYGFFDCPEEPNLDLSHLSAEERAMIQNVMAKAKEIEEPSRM
ncbi:hypothetical protein AAG570_012771 [Ranatra chinensis]|uniref:Uncharacterized protein n=1 Tax=Ranatra chinensis TaxID=642074 RepID=A0ABD0YEY7_9HEMI